jgi:hypothetical protein
MKQYLLEITVGKFKGERLWCRKMNKKENDIYKKSFFLFDLSEHYFELRKKRKPIGIISNKKSIIIKTKLA